MIDADRLAQKARAMGLALTAGQLGCLVRHADLLAEWNQKMNLTAIAIPEQVEDRHFLDSLVLASQPELQESLADIGSGAGFPGMVAAVLRPDLQVTLMEPNGKRLRFLDELRRNLGPEVENRVVLLQERAEEAARKGWRESFATVTARAVAALPALCEYCLPLLRPGGYFIAMKTEAEEELQQAAKALEALGAEHRETRRYCLPDGSSRSLILIKKLRATPARYPRGGGAIAKRPL